MTAERTLPWTQPEIETLARMWPSHQASEVAKALNRSRNAVIGKANRLGLERKISGPTRKAASCIPIRPIRPRNPVKRVVMAGHVAPVDGCAFPHGDPGKTGFHFCGLTPVVKGKSYCRKHTRICYYKPKAAA